MNKIVTTLIFLFFFSLTWDSYFLLETNFPTSPSILIFSILVLIYIGNLIQHKKIKYDEAFIWLLFLLLLMFVSMIYSPGEHLLSYFIRILSYFLILVVLYNITLDYNLNNNILWGYFLGVLSVSIFSFWFLEIDLNRFTLSSDFNPTWLAAQILWGVILSIYFYKKSNLAIKIILIISNIFLLYIMILTVGKNAIITLLVSLILGFILTRKKLGETIRISVLTLLIGFSLYFLVIKTGFHEMSVFTRFTNLEYLFTSESDLATSGRTTIWTTYYQNINNFNFFAILFGKGLLSSTANFHITAHNAFLTLLFELGVLGVIIILLFHFKVIKQSRNSSKVLFVFAIALLVLGFGNDTIYYKYWWTGIWLYFVLYIVDVKKRYIANI